ncbi:hypothetical protein [Paenibacillus sp. YYML68]|uniref:hypothetical protein n=1 Tax=Paenibacillus sp. YYML68 TaxID=2909250 RepID=UPI0024935FD4|nr:hypothetical protein [Paenibacillus sp. YYML68]
MNKPLALLFAFIGTGLLAAVSYFMAAGRPWLAVVAGVVSFFFIGFGFIVKAKQRKRNS